MKKVSKYIQPSILKENIQSISKQNVCRIFLKVCWNTVERDLSAFTLEISFLKETVQFPSSLFVHLFLCLVRDEGVSPSLFWLLLLGEVQQLFVIFIQELLYLTSSSHYLPFHSLAPAVQAVGVKGLLCFVIQQWLCLSSL